MKRIRPITLRDLDAAMTPNGEAMAENERLAFAQVGRAYFDDPDHSYSWFLQRAFGPSVEALGDAERAFIEQLIRFGIVACGAVGLAPTQLLAAMKEETDG